MEHRDHLNQANTQNSVAEYESEFEGVPIAKLIEKWGSPLFVLSEKQIRHNVRKLKRTFTNHYPDVIHGWSYKTNYLNAVCNIMHQEGSYAEVVSFFEYEKARALGVPNNRIIFNGPNKNYDTLKILIENDVKIHCDHMDELKLCNQITKELNKEMEISLRLNFQNDYTENWGRFGFNLESGQAHEAVYFISECPFLKISGLHSHIGTFVLDIRAYTKQVEKMVKFLNWIEQNTDFTIQYFDVGGGFASKNSLQGIYAPSDSIVPDIEDYAGAICEPLIDLLEDRTKAGKKLPTLILESGRWVIDDAEILLTTAIGNKKLPSGKKCVILDSGVNNLFTGFWYNHEVALTKKYIGSLEETILYGPLCMNIDVVRSSIMLPQVHMGDVLMIKNVGAYNNTQWMQFIEYRPNIVIIDTYGDDHLVREKETLEDMNYKERLPEHLKFLTTKRSIHE